MEKGKVVLVVIIIFALDCGFTQKQNLKHRQTHMIQAKFMQQTITDFAIIN